MLNLLEKLLSKLFPVQHPRTLGSVAHVIDMEAYRQGRGIVPFRYGDLS